MRRRRLRARCGGRIAEGVEIEEAGIDAVTLQEGLEGGQLRLDGVAQDGGLLGDGGAAEKDDAGQHGGQRQANDGEPHRLR